MGLAEAKPEADSAGLQAAMVAVDYVYHLHGKKPGGVYQSVQSAQHSRQSRLILHIAGSKAAMETIQLTALEARQGAQHISARIQQVMLATNLPLFASGVELPAPCCCKLVQRTGNSLH